MTVTEEIPGPHKTVDAHFDDIYDIMNEDSQSFTSDAERSASSADGVFIEEVEMRA